MATKLVFMTLIALNNVEALTYAVAQSVVANHSKWPISTPSVVKYDTKNNGALHKALVTPTMWLVSLAPTLCAPCNLGILNLIGTLSSKVAWVSIIGGAMLDVLETSNYMNEWDSLTCLLAHLSMVQLYKYNLHWGSSALLVAWVIAAIVCTCATPNCWTLELS